MDDRTYLLLVLLVLYALESIAWIPVGAVMFLNRSLIRRRQIGKGNMFRNPEGGFRFLGILPSNLGCLSQPWPISMSSLGAYAYVATSIEEDTRPKHTGCYIAWDEVSSVEVESGDILVNGKLFAQTCSECLANQIAGSMKRVTQASGSQRVELIRSILRETTSLSSIQLRRSHLEQVIRLPIIITSIMWLLAFVVGPTVLFLSPANVNSVIAGWFVVALFLFSWVSAVVAYRRGLKHLRKVLPTSSVQDRTWSLLMSPASAMRAPDHLAKDVLADFHPVCVAFVICRFQEFRAFATRFMRDARHPMIPVHPDADSRLQKTEVFFREEMLSVLTREFANEGVSLLDWIVTPIPCSDAKSYCPRCEAQYILAQGFCQPCGGVQLVSFGGYSSSRHTPIEPSDFSELLIDKKKHDS